MISLDLKLLHRLYVCTTYRNSLLLSRNPGTSGNGHSKALELFDALGVVPIRVSVEKTSSWDSKVRFSGWPTSLSVEQ